jgi:hypothetical protein
MEIKAVIALPDEVFVAAEVLARRLGLSRGELCAQAVAEFVSCHRRWGSPREVPCTARTVDGCPGCGLRGTAIAEPEEETCPAAAPAGTRGIGTGLA